LRHRDPMTFYFERLVDFVGAHPQLSFVAVFLLALSEAIPVIGTVVPGSTLILAISALATAAGITPWGLLVAAVAGAIAGDGFSFWLGHRYHRQILRGWPLNRFPRLIGRSAQLIRKYGVASVFLARFTAVVRAFVPLLAGVVRMSSRHFYVANVLSALVWAPIHIFPGVLVGLAIAFGGAHAPELSLAAVGALILAWIAWSLIKRKTASIMDRSGNQDAPGPGTRESALRCIAHETAPDVARPASPRDSASGRPTQRAKSGGTQSDSARLLFSPQNPSGDPR
jgi:membrane protein DedA with SNARE-associated domain